MLKNTLVLALMLCLLNNAISQGHHGNRGGGMGGEMGGGMGHEMGHGMGPGGHHHDGPDGMGPGGHHGDGPDGMGPGGHHGDGPDGMGPGGHHGNGPEMGPGGPHGDRPDRPDPHHGPPGPHFCAPDFMRFCALQVPAARSPEDIIKCLDAHLEELQPPCKEMVGNATQIMDDFHSACDADLDSICPGAKDSIMEAKQCAVENLARLDTGCLQTISNIAKEMHEHHGPRPGPHGPHDADARAGYLEEFMQMSMEQERTAEQQYDAPVASHSASGSGSTWVASSKTETASGDVAFAKSTHMRPGRGILMVLAAGCLAAFVVVCIGLLVRAFVQKRRSQFNGSRAPQHQGLQYPPMGTPLVDEVVPQGASMA